MFLLLVNIILSAQLIIRSQEGPDARAGRDEFGDMLSGYSIDHDGESGKLYTLFSAPDYPQVQICIHVAFFIINIHLFNCFAFITPVAFPLTMS